jgi:outer membrane protein assembly factor BamB
VSRCRVVVGDLAIAGGIGNGVLLAVDVASGATKWSWKGMVPYASIVADRTRQIVTQSQRHIVGVSLADGRLLWEMPFTTSMTNSITSRRERSSHLRRPQRRPPPFNRAPRSGRSRQSGRTPTPMYEHARRIGRVSLRADASRPRPVFCLDLRTGKTMWTTKGREGRTPRSRLPLDWSAMTTETSS